MVEISTGDEIAEEVDTVDVGAGTAMTAIDVELDFDE